MTESYQFILKMLRRRLPPTVSDDAGLSRLSMAELALCSFDRFSILDLLYLNGRDLCQLPLIERKEKLRALIEKSALRGVICCGKYVEERGVDLFNEVCQRNLEGVVAKRKTGTYSTISGWLKIKNPNYTQSERRHELFESFKTKSTSSQRNLPPIPKKPLRRVVELPKKVDGTSSSRSGRTRLRG